MIKPQNSVFIYAIVVVGVILRLIWVEDMEWKDDEKIMFLLAHNYAEKGNLPFFGMMSGGGIINPGLSVGFFSLIAVFTETPVAMARSVQLVNVMAFVLFLFFINKQILGSEKEKWLWGLAIAAISPLAVLYSRKIWAQDILPLFTFFLIWSHFNRQKKWGTFLWGFSGMLIGQIHMSGFFLAAGIFIFTLLHDWSNRLKINWFFFMLGTMAGVSLLVPWIIYSLTHEQGSYLTVEHILQFNFYKYFMLDALGINLQVSMREVFWEFLKEPVISGKSFYFSGILHCVLVFSGLLAMTKLMVYIYIKVRNKSLGLIIKNISDSNFYLISIFIGLGLLMTFSGTEIYPHYLIVVFPFSYVFLAKLLFAQKWILKTVIVSQLIITLLFLHYVHQHDGVLKGDYKRTYKSQKSIEQKMDTR